MKKYLILIVFLLLTIGSARFISKVKVNYNLENYLPEDSEIKAGIDIYQDEFGDLSTATFSFNETDIAAALLIKEDISTLDNIAKVIFIDDFFNELTYGIIRATLTPDQQLQFDGMLAGYLGVGMNYPEAFIALINFFPTEQKTEFEAILAGFISEDEMLMKVVISADVSDPECETAIEAIKTKLSDEGYSTYFSGTAVSTLFTRNTIEKEVLIITIICIPIVLGVLLLLSRSYLDIIVFGIVVGVSVIINLGTNALLPDISFITKSMAIVLQIAISLDYVIFMINAYHRGKVDGLTTEDAIKHAKKKSMKPIIASALTTGVSFLALVFMRFSIGLDIGIVFAKAIIISLLSTVLLLPVLIEFFAKIIEKSTKKSKSLFSGKLAEKLYKFRYYFLVLLLVVLGGSIYVQTQAEYTYGSASFAGAEGTEYYEDLQHIESVFGRTNTVVIILPKDDIDEATLYTSLVELDYVDAIQAGIYYKSIIADPLVLAVVTADLYSENYAIIQFNMDSNYEGDEAFANYEEIKTIIETQEIEAAYILGETSIAYNIKDTVSFDYNLVLVIAIVAVMIIILITFKNFLMPILLPLVIETSVFFTMALLYFVNNEMVFLATLIVSAILLGVTIDYAILLSKTYMELREVEDKKTSIKRAIRDSAPSIITSATLFSISGLSISIISSITTIAQIGLIIAVGAITSLFYVLIILPQLLSIFDRWICKSHININRK